MVRNRIRMLRKEEGYSQKELGKILGVGQTAVSAWEIGRNEPDNEASHKMAKLLGCSIGYLMGYESESETRGLTQIEWNKFQRQKLFKRERDKIEQELDDENEELKHIAETMEKEIMIDAWEESGRAILPETIEIESIMEDLTNSQRKALLNMIKSAKSAFGK